MPGLNLIYTHLNRVRNRDANVIYTTGPARGCGSVQSKQPTSDTPLSAVDRSTSEPTPSGAGGT